MIKDLRIALSLVLATFGGWAAADAQTRSPAGTDPRPIAATTRAASRPASAPRTAARRASASSYNRLTSLPRRGYGSASPRGGSPGASAEDDPLRPYSAEVRRADSWISPTRLAEAPPNPPRVQPPTRYNYFPGMRSGRPIRHCTPSRGGVLAGSLGRGR